MKYSIKGSLILLCVAVLWGSCGKEGGECDFCPQDEPIIADYAPQPYVPDIPDWMGPPVIPADNPLTKAGVALGRMLFYDPILSADSTLSCSGCHRPELSFTDGERFSTGVEGRQTARNAMPLVNLIFSPNGFFWDGRVVSLEEQALHPVMDEIEFNEDWDNVVKKLQRHPAYPRRFREAFGIERKSEITKELAAKALAQFQRILISKDSRYDRASRGQQLIWLTDSEQRGKDLFTFEPTLVDHPGCTHCHSGANFVDYQNQFRNNGLDSVASRDDFPDKGLGGFTGRPIDMGRFKVPTLRNIALTAPYMHDGRFATLEEVLDHYSKGGHGGEYTDALIVPFSLSEQQKKDMVAFLNTLTDTAFIKNPEFSNPFE